MWNLGKEIEKEACGPGGKNMEKKKLVGLWGLRWKKRLVELGGRDGRKAVELGKEMGKGSWSWRDRDEKNTCGTGKEMRESLMDLGKMGKKACGAGGENGGGERACRAGGKEMEEDLWRWGKKMEKKPVELGESAFSCLWHLVE